MKSLHLSSFWVILVLTASSAYSDDSVIANRRLFNDSIKEFPSEPNGMDPYVSRTLLTPAELSEKIDFIVGFEMPNWHELQARTDRGERVSEAEMAARYTPTESDYVRVRSWLRSEGFTIRREDRSRLSISAQGTVSQIQKSFVVDFVRVTTPEGDFSSVNSAPSMPEEIAVGVLGIMGFQPPVHPVGRPPFPINPSFGRAPYQRPAGPPPPFIPPPEPPSIPPLASLPPPHVHSADVAVVNGRRIFTDSIKVVSTQQSAAFPYVSRTNLTPTELSAKVYFSILLLKPNLQEFLARVDRRDKIPDSELAARFTPSASAYAAIKDWLISEGFQLYRDDKFRLSVFASGTISQIQKSFQVAFVRVHTPDGEFSSINSPPSMPVEVSEGVSGILGLQQHSFYHILNAEPARIQALQEGKNSLTLPPPAPPPAVPPPPVGRPEDVVVVNGRRIFYNSFIPLPVGDTRAPAIAVILRTTLTSAELAEKIELIISLTLRNEGEFQDMVQHGIRISESAFAARYKPPESTYSVLKNWLRSEGFTIREPDPAGGISVEAEGTVSQVQKSLHVTFVRVLTGGIEMSWINSPPSMPAEISEGVSGIMGLQNSFFTPVHGPR